MFIIGDTHGLDKLYRILTDFLAQNKLVKHYENIEKGVHNKYPVGCLSDSTFIHVGDVGVGFHRLDEDKYFLNLVNDVLVANKSKLYMIRGNHDNPAFFGINSTPELDVFTKSFSNIVFVHDWTVLSLESKCVLFIGGAVSIDRHARTEGVDYWKDEVVLEISDSDLVDYAEMEIDIIISHSAPCYVFPLTSYVSDWFPQLTKDVANERRYLQDVYNTINTVRPVTKWGYGHFHQTVETHVGTRFQCVGIEQIIEL